MTLVDDKVDVDPAQPFLGFQLHDTIRTSLFESETRAVLRQRFKDSSGFTPANNMRPTHGKHDDHQGT